MDILLLTDRTEELSELSMHLERAGHRVGIASFEDPPASGPEPDFALVDAVKDFPKARERCRQIRNTGTSCRVVVIVSPASLEAVGPDWQIDTYVIDNANPAACADDLLARIRLLTPVASDSGSILRVGELAIDPDSYQVRLRGRPLDLTYKEFQLLSFLAQRPGRVFSRSMLLQEVWGYDFFGGTRTVDVHIRRLRAKLGAEYESMIGTVRNVGYKMEVPPRAFRGAP